MEIKKYAEIIDKGECLSTINTNNFLQWGVLEKIKSLAGRNEWDKYGFYPSNELVGEIIGTINNPLWGFEIQMLKIQNKFYVPMSPKGIKIISENEYIQKQSKNTPLGMDDRQQKINTDYNNFIERSYSIGKPQYKDYFKEDLANNIGRLSNNFTKNIYIWDIIEEGVMYSCDICLEFKRKADFISKDWILHISSEVCNAFSDTVKEFNDNNRIELMKKVFRIMSNDLLDDEFLQQEINDYYGR